MSEIVNILHLSDLHFGFIPYKNRLSFYLRETVLFLRGVIAKAISISRRLLC